MKKIAAAALNLSVALSSMSFAGSPPSDRPRQPQTFVDPSGMVETLSITGGIDPHNAFFRALGTNGRSCGTCHVPDQAFGLSAAAARTVFRDSRGQDPLFAPVDGSNCPSASRDDAAAHSLLLHNGLIRISIPLPSNAEFTVSVAHDPYGCAMTLDALSLRSITDAETPGI
ncbi:MAG: hypothetical protein ACREVO_18065 [Steroidobacteraceae bacterium]